MTLLIREFFNDQKTVSEFNKLEYEQSVNLYPDSMPKVVHDLVITEDDEVYRVILEEE